MIEQELEVLKATEEECRRILREAEEQKADILQKARELAAQDHEASVRDKKLLCEQHLQQQKERIAAARDERLRQWEATLQGVREGGAARMEGAVQHIFEGMWENGNRSDDLFQPDGAKGCQG